MSYRWLIYILCSIGIFTGIVNIAHANTDPAQATPLRYELLLDEEARYYHVLPGSQQQWKVIGAEFVNLYSLTLNYFTNLYQSVVESIHQSTPWGLGIGAVFLLIFWIFCYVVTRLGRKIREHQLFPVHIQNTFIGQVVYYTAELWLRNVALLELLGSISLALIYLATPNLLLLFSLFGVIIAAKFISDIARIVLLENIADREGHDIQLYHALEWCIVFAGILACLTLLAHLMTISVYMTGFIDRLFLLVIFILSISLLKNWRAIPFLLQPYIQRRYLQRAVSILSALIPLVLMSTAIIGLVGYVVLAWRIGIAEIKLLLVTIGWIVVRGLANDLMTWLSDLFIRRVSNGWLWTEAILKPLRRIVNLIIFVAMLWVLLWVYGFEQGSLLVSQIQKGLQYSLFTLGGTDITPLKLILFTLILTVVVWLAKWSREFAYRWLFSGTKDYGLRNTFAVFTQYTAVFVGGLIVLKVVGIDLTTLTVVLGALSLGIGIGLQSLANSLVSGFILLIERPLQVGDLVKIGDNEGEVTRVGMRSITLNSSDHKEVIIPNADTISQSVINSTHRDNVVRVNVPIRVGFDQDPHKVKAVIEQVLNEHVGVLAEPPIEVLLWSFGESAMVFDVRFYIEVRTRYTSSVSQAQSDVLFKIWDGLRANKIPLPYPQQNVTMTQTQTKSK